MTTFRSQTLPPAPSDLLRLLGFEQLSDEERSRISASNELLTKFLSDLQEEEVDRCMASIRNKALNMPFEVSQMLLQLLEGLKNRIIERNEEIHRDVRPIAAGIASALVLQQKIVQLENFQHSLS